MRVRVRVGARARVRGRVRARVRVRVRVRPSYASLESHVNTQADGYYTLGGTIPRCRYLRNCVLSRTCQTANLLADLLTYLLTC